MRVLQVGSSISVGPAFCGGECYGPMEEGAAGSRCCDVFFAYQGLQRSQFQNESPGIQQFSIGDDRRMVVIGLCRFMVTQP